MRKTAFLVLLIVASFLCTMCGSKKSFNPEDLTRIASFKEATVVKSITTDQTAETFPGTFIFVLFDGTTGIIYMTSLPTLHSHYDSILAKMEHGNVTILNFSGKTYGVLPKHMFGDDKDLEEMMRASGFNVGSKGDIVTVEISKNQASVNSEVLTKLDPDKLDNIPCTIKTLNCFEGDLNLYQYTIKGTLHYLSPEEGKYILLNSRNSYGERVTEIPTEGLYVVKVPNDLFNEIPGMSGGSVTVTVNGKEYFLGMNTHRMVLGMVSKNDTVVSTLIGIQPVIAGDIN